jgi:phosphatidylglycerophosphatase A
LLPKAPGTWGSLAARPLAWLLYQIAGTAGLLVGAVLVFALGWWASSLVVRNSSAKDPGAIVIDEVAAQMLVIAAAPDEPLAYLFGFLLFRLADIFKPWPASWADRNVSGGIGVMLDDLFAALYAGALVYLGRIALGR